MTASALSAAELQQRALNLRRLAHSIEQLDATVLYRRAGTDTWIGPTAQRCINELITARTLLLQAADASRVAARQLELRSFNV